MELKELYYFKTVVDSTSILKASKILHISQPPLSRMMKNLEIELNCKLFIRGRTLKLTDQGKILYDKASSILELSNNLVKEIDEVNNNESYTLNIGLVTSSTSLLYSNNLKNYSKDYPKVKFKISESNTFNLLEMLDNKIINLAITRTPFNNSNYNISYFGKEKMVLTSNSNIGNSITLKEISTLKCVIYRRFEHIILHEFQKANLSLNVIALVDDAKTAILLAKTLNLHAIVPYGAYNTFKEGLYRSLIDDANLETELCAVTRIGEEIEEPYKKFIEYLKK